MARSKTDFDGLTPEGLLELVERIYVKYPRGEEVLSKIAHCQTYSEYSAEPECMLIEGDTGSGKTTMSRRHEQKHPRYESASGTVIPVLMATIPVPATPKSLVTKLLKKLGDPVAERGTIVTQTLRLHGLLKACRVQLIILDEFQHFQDRDSKKILETISDWLKELLNETKIPIILMGMPNCGAVLEANSQLRRRFAIRESLEAFRWKDADVAKQKQLRDDFRRFLQMLDKQIPLAKRSNLSDPVTAYRIYEATEGKIASIVKLVRRSVALALQDGEEIITLQILSTAYTERLAHDRLDKDNPFLPLFDTNKHDDK